jgi:PAS domain S-box-containing protein
MSGASRAVFLGWHVASHKRNLWILLILLHCFPLHAIDRDRKLADLYHTAWTFKNGAPAEIHALAQTRDGFLWLGSASGLFRFDGIRFQQYEPPPGQKFRQRGIRSLFATPDDGLWVGYWYGGASFIREGKIIDYGAREGLSSHAVLGFARDRRGAVWVAEGEDGLARFEVGRWEKIGKDRGFTGPASSVFVDRSGTLWVGTPTRVEYFTEGATRFQTAAENLQFAMNFAESPDGALWMAETGRGVRTVPLPGRKNSEIATGSQAIAFDDQGSLWIATLGDGIIRVPFPGLLGSSKIAKTDARLQRLTKYDGLTANYVLCVLQDREGNIWFGTSGGLDQFHESAFVSQSAPGGSLVHALVSGNGGSLWVASVGPNSVTRLKGGEANYSWKGAYIDCVYVDRHGFIWLESPGWPDGAIFRLDDKELHNRPGVPYGYYVYRGPGAPPDQGNTRRRNSVEIRALDVPLRSGPFASPAARAAAMTSDDSGRLWISTELGTFRLDKSGWTSLQSIGGPPGSAVSELTDSEGRVWFGLNNEVAMFHAGTVTVFSRAEGVQSGTVSSIQEEGSRIWIAGESGVQYLDGDHFRSIDSADGATFTGVSAMIADPGKGLFLSTPNGADFIAESELRRLSVQDHRVAVRTFGLLDGLTSALLGGAAHPSIARIADGRIWFATTNGLAWIDPDRIPGNAVPPSVMIESVVANGRQYDISGVVRFPSGTKNLQIAYTAPSLTIPERVQFRYRLKGQDKEWQEPGTRRQAFYTNLDPGSYTFQVIACNNDGVWNNEGAALTFSVAPAWYQTNWFLALCVAALLGLLWALHQFRTWRLRQSELKLRKVIATIPTFAWTALPDGSVDFLNRHYEDYTGSSVDKAVGSRWTAVVHPEDLQRHLEKFRASMATGELFEIESRFRRADGQYRWFLTRAVPLRDLRDKIVKWYGTSIEIEDRRRAEQLQADLAHINRVSTMSELTASLAHEIKQPIGAAVTNAEACLRLLNRNEPDVADAREAALEMTKDARRAADIIDHVRLLYQKGRSQLEPVDVNEVVAEMLTMLRNQADHSSVTIRADLAEGMPPVMADRVQLQQVLMNLMLNAIEAMKDGGELGIKSKLSEPDQLLISISDTGEGLPPEKADEIFNAFFTTKPQGTGLGLAITRSILEAHGGRVWATPNAGRGTTFHFTLPLRAPVFA